jgi:hypothetical protein
MAGSILQIMAWVVGIFGSLGGILSLSNGRSYDNPGLGIIGASIVSAAILYGLGTAFIHIEEAARDARRAADAAERSAEALEYLTRRQRQVVAQQRQTDAKPSAAVQRNTGQ